MRSDHRDHPSHFWRILERIGTLAVIIVCGAVTWDIVRRWDAPTTTNQQAVGRSGQSSGPLPSSPVPLAGAHLKGSPDAKIGIIEYSDFQCPFCGVFARETLPEFTRQYIDSGKVLLAFQHLPITTLHPLAVDAAVAADCAGEQGHFWAMHDSIFSSKQPLS